MLEALEKTASEERFTVNDLVKYRDREEYDLLSQRSYVWNLNEKSDLIHSLAALYDIGSFYINVVNGKHRVMDGQQRRRTIISYVLNEFKLNDDVEDILLINNIETGERKVFHLAGKYFNELELELQNIIKNRTIVNKIYNNLSIERESIIINKRNSGRGFTNIEKTVMETFNHVQPFVKRVLEHNFFKKIKLSSLSLKGKSLDSIVHRFIAIELGINKGFNTSILKKAMIEIDRLELIDEEIEHSIFEKIKYLDESFPETSSNSLGRNNTPLVYMLCEIAIDDNCPPLEFGGIIQAFVNENGRGIDNPSFKSIRFEIKKMENFYNENVDKGLIYKLRPLRSKNNN